MIFFFYGGNGLFVQCKLAMHGEPGNLVWFNEFHKIINVIFGIWNNNSYNFCCKRQHPSKQI